MDLKLTPIARSGVNFANGEAAPQPLLCFPIELHSKFGNCSIVHCRGRFSDGTSKQVLEKQSTHSDSLKDRAPSRSN